MRYCSYETRIVIDQLSQYGITLAESEYIRVEKVIGLFYQSHVTGVISKVLKPTAIERAQESGWSWFEKPIVSILTPRVVAHRPNKVEFEITEHVERCYNMVVAHSVCDFNMAELALAVIDIPKLSPDSAFLSYCIAAARKMNNRSVYYLHGIIKREASTRAGKIAELRKQSEESSDLGWLPDTEPLDIVESRILKNRWKDKLSDIDITLGLRNAETEKS